jgi:toxin FitB
VILVDSCGWLEVFTDGPAAGTYATLLAHPEELLVPTVVLYEVYKLLARTAGEETALRCSGFMQQARIVPLDAPLALEAADLSTKQRLAMADAIVYATAVRYRAELATSDSDLEGLPGVRFIAT